MQYDLNEYNEKTAIRNLRGERMNKKRIRIIIIIALCLILLFPITLRYNDGGTVRYQAILYSITDYHSFRGVDGYDTGIEIKILGITVYENTTFGQ